MTFNTARLNAYLMGAGDCRWCEASVITHPLTAMWVHTGTKLPRCISPIDPFTGAPLDGVWLADVDVDVDLCDCGECDFCG